MYVCMYGAVRCRAGQGRAEQSRARQGRTGQDRAGRAGGCAGWGLEGIRAARGRQPTVRGRELCVQRVLVGRVASQRAARDAGAGGDILERLPVRTVDTLPMATAKAAPGRTHRVVWARRREVLTR